MTNAELITLMSRKRSNMTYDEALERRAYPAAVRTIGGYYRSEPAFNPVDRYVVVDSVTLATIQSEPTKAKADKAANGLNEHELANNRAQVYRVEEITKLA